ncbi:MULTISPECIES: 3-hydroxyacyl-CoA dehydrogenase family protein [Streptomyces]|nr:3-hydroxyacyl-CoA dehydrogenase family protein [Streptomyces tsukubensis]ADU56319.1 glyceryl-ACP oxidoreductase [Streptomyces sp. KCTC 11604BP]AZK92759.1 3-hydroxyacyl-CoA dehydrogenase [Streptomyces tsukubensis]EIF88200.1 methoxymalonate biosynthesis protein [Streptomyces tsukubensis NRRL18488]
MVTPAGGSGTERRILVLGAGVMGTGITTLALRHGVHVTLVDTSETILAAARKRIAAELRMAHLLTGPAEADPGELTTVTSARTEPGTATAVIEAVVEDATVKAQVLAAVSAAVPPGTPIITNTSSIPVDELADAVARPQDLLGTHFMNPSYAIPMVEVVRGPRSGEAAMAAAADLLAVLGRKAIVVRDAPGFVTSRLLHPMINDAARVVQEGTASVEDVDALMTGCLGHPTGPLRTADLIGIDNLVDALWVLHKRTGDDRSRPCDLLLTKVRDGHHGRKTGRGFYPYEEVFR